ncbi:MAG: magnesium transporter CorA family protein, partial [Mycoplasmatales bacterium]
MIEIFSSVNDRLTNATIDDKRTWISLINPTIEELELVEQKTGCSADFLNASLDPEESSRVDKEDDQLLIIINASFENQDENENIEYLTVPVGIILLDQYIITVSIEKVNCIEYFKNSFRKDIDVNKKTRFTLQIIYQMAVQYLAALRKIDRKTDDVERLLYGSLKNEYLFELLSLEKTIVYFTTALSGNEKLMRKLFRTQFLKRYDEDEDLLEDTIIELQQATEMAQINGQVLRSLRDAFASIISNNLNNVMKT